VLPTIVDPLCKIGIDIWMVEEPKPELGLQNPRGIALSSFAPEIQSGGPSSGCGGIASHCPCKPDLIFF
jgi:hypothetical protein